MQLDRNFFLNLNKPLVLDGPMGTLLIERGVNLGSKLWSALALINHPEEVKKIHSEYIQSGADIITTNTFRTNPYAVKLSGTNYSSQELVRKAVQFAKESINAANKKILIAGSNAPADDCYLTKRIMSKDEQIENHYLHIQYLIEAGVDFILNETFGDKEEIEIVCSICKEFHFPFAVSVLINSELKTFFGQNLFETIEMIFNYEPNFISLNCTRPEFILQALEILNDFKPFGVYPNLGSIESFQSGKLVRDFTDSQLNDFVKKLIDNGVRVIGVCCGGNPNDIKLIRKIVDSL
ncbi:MAG: homocysteine S-methyltransferase family protein [Ignavibacteria bacterium]|jgi:S-methylmethionine-dependent homocysteine/selenocysteine methylase|nr:homocysteine S-methyltransferase family protein [Ignavibacteria bacterium]MDH7527026.1 homocysteine S-methyltransferase family protein [Ignavibacteria bacterium]